ncbi:DUF7144 family membrane protein [Actinacidiphila epipremni]|jgi:hypothetical protein|uniref:DUF7144 domain-containing protein n=1 Tax=Actinacidiphila epipremni TaxID=2053013 RepID=A0ABX0ZHZ2_9ACTN|nr:hypothetical protein [Actinacidiphila epipremni]NJP43459.1 hypothetical protein [Actinacidiphila epipremni]
MSQANPAPQPPPPDPGGGRGSHHPHDGGDGRRAWAAGGTVFAGILLVVGGVLAVLEGVLGIARDSVLVVTRGGYAYHFNLRAWGWIHLVLGVLAFMVGIGLLNGATWARYAGIAIAALNMVANFMFLPYQPIWSLIMIAIDLFIIWSLTVHHHHRIDKAGGTR